MIALMVAMETMHFFIVQLSLSLRTKILCISGVPMNDLAPMKNCPGGGGCKVGQISSRGKGFQGFFSILCRHVPHILKMCMKNYNDEKIFFDKYTAIFNIAIF